MIDKLDINTKAQSLRRELGEDLESSIDIFSLAHELYHLYFLVPPVALESLIIIYVKNETEIF